MEQKMKAYKVFKCVLGFIYKLWYNPKIYGVENIPQEGAVVLAGNHVNIMDQCNIIVVCKRCIHFMAKKEYFDNKKVAWFFKSTGCIPVDRSKKDESAKEAGIEVLENDNVLGIFPEGTRNNVKEQELKELYDSYYQDKMSYEEFSKKMAKNKKSHINYLEELKNNQVITEEEYIDNIVTPDAFLHDLLLNRRISKDEYYEHSLLPFKFGAVSMAYKTNAVIVPYAISGDYKFRSKNLRVHIGKPITVTEDYTESNQKLTNAMIELLKENNEN